MQLKPDEIMDQMKSTELMANIGSLITSSLEFNEILEGIMMEVRLYFRPKNWSLLRFDQTSNTLVFAIAEGIQYSDVKDIRLKAGEGIAGSVIGSGKSIFVPDTSLDDRFTDRIDRITGFTTHSVIAVPIMTKGKMYGVIEIINREDDSPFSEDDHIILKTVADFSAIAFENNHVYSKAINRSEVDQLTGLYNQARLKKTIDMYSDPASPHRREVDQSGHVITVYLDLDMFKEVNDMYGHAEGDEVLRRVSMRLQSLFRSDDLIFRIGGDEFLVIFNISNESDIETIIERIDLILSSLKITSMEKGYTVGLSFGIVHGPPETLADQIHEADLVMYENKKSKQA